MPRLQWLVSASLALSLTACGGNWKTAYRAKTISDSNGSISVVTVDALQRHLVISHGSQGKAVMRYCAERAPDAFSVLAAALNANANVDVAARSGSLGLNISAAETGSLIRRTQSVNLLAESLYRTCERYMNFDGDPDSLKVQARRDANNIVAVLAIEQLTSIGVPPPPTVVLASSATTGASSAVDTLQKSYEAVQKAREAHADAVAELAKIKGDGNAGKSCQDSNLAEGPLKECSDQQKTVERLATAKAEREKLYTSQLNLSGGGGSALSVAGNGAVTPVEIKVASLSDASVAKISETVREIVSMNFVANDPCKDGTYPSEERRSRCGGYPVDYGSTTPLPALRSTIPAESIASISSNIYVQIADEGQRAIARKLMKTLATTLSEGNHILGVEYVSSSPFSNQLRYYDDEGQINVEKLEEALTRCGIAVEPLRLNGFRNVSRGVVELWFGRNWDPTTAKQECLKQ